MEHRKKELQKNIFQNYEFASDVFDLVTFNTNQSHQFVWNTIFKIIIVCAK